MKIINTVFLIILYLMKCMNMIGQDSSMSVYNGTIPNSKYTDTFVYLHTDRSYYLTGESILFKAYILDDFNNRSHPVNDTLYVVLLDQDGALIIVDGIKMGTDVELLNNIPLPDVARITASTNVLDIQRYSAMNSVGIIEIFMKKNNDFVKNEETSAKSKSSTLFWGPDIITDSSGKASISFFNNDKSAEVIISVDGIAANGLYGSSSIHYSVK